MHPKVWHGRAEGEYLPDLASGRKIGAFSSLSRKQALMPLRKTLAEDKGDHYLLNGTKNWISSANCGSVYIVMAQTYPDLSTRGNHAFIVEKEWPGISLSPHEDKMGRGAPIPIRHVHRLQSPERKPHWRRRLWIQICHEAAGRGRNSIAARPRHCRRGFRPACRYAQERKALANCSSTTRPSPSNWRTCMSN